MNYDEFMKSDGDKVGTMVWICDYRYNNVLEKPIRHVKPMKVEVFSNDDLPKNKRVYYSAIHFRPIGAKGIALKRVIAPFDNTGYRSYTGVSLGVFLNESECIEYYLEQCKEAKDEIELERARMNEKLDGALRNIDSTMIELT